MPHILPLAPKFESVKSYYGKAEVLYSGSVSTLISYSTEVAEFNWHTGVLKINGEYSVTTLRHIREFAQQMGFPKLSVSDMRKRGYVLVKEEI